MWRAVASIDSGMAWCALKPASTPAISFSTRVRATAGFMSTTTTRRSMPKRSGWTLRSACPLADRYGDEGVSDCAEASKGNVARTMARKQRVIPTISFRNGCLWELEALGGLGDCAEQCAAFVHGFFPLGGRVGVVDDAAAGLHVQAAVLDHGGADGDGRIRIAPPAQPADGAGVDVALERFQLLDDLQRADLRCT